MAVTALGAILLIVSILSLCGYVVALVKLTHRPYRPGLIRTAACRVGVAVAYVGVAVITLLGLPSLIAVALCVFIGAQAVWQTNSILDVRLTEGKQ